MKPRVQNAKGSVVGPGDDDKLLVWQDSRIKPEKKPVLGDHRSGNKSFDRSKSPSDRGNRLPQKPPVSFPDLSSAGISQRLNNSHYMLIRPFEESRLFSGHRNSKVNDPCIGRAARYVQSIGPRPQYISAGTAVRIR